MSRVDADLSTTSYAILGLLAIQPWSTYELARQMDRSLGRMWPRAASKLYEEPKKLVARGLARADAGTVGRRPRTVYSITPRGRRVLRAWLELPGAPPSLEYEQLLKIFFAEHGTRTDVAARIAEMRAWALEQREQHSPVASSYLAGAGLFQARAAQTQLTGTFLFELSEMVLRWATWAGKIVATWPEDVSQAKPSAGGFRDVIRRAGSGER